MPQADTKWNLTKIPPKGHKDVAGFAYQLFEMAAHEKERLGKHDDWLSNYALYRGQDDRQAVFSGKRKKVPSSLVNLYFANIERTVSNITARKPTGEVVDLDGGRDNVERLLSVALEKWWQNTGQQMVTRKSARSMEIYGITAEKPQWDEKRDIPAATVTDPFQFFPAPGAWDRIDEDAPYICYAYLKYIDEAEYEFGVDGIAEENAYDLLGQGRENYKPDGHGGGSKTIGNYENVMTMRRDGDESRDQRLKQCLVVETWVRDKSEKKISEENLITDDETGRPVLDEFGEPLIEVISRDEPVYRDGIRVITITKAKDDAGHKDGYMVLEDAPNPNLNPRLSDGLANKTHPWGRLPVYIANSYKDLVSLWGFSAAEQVADLISEINTIIRKMVNYVKNVMEPPLVVQKNCGVTREMIETNLRSGGRLVLMPTTPNARIEFLQVPNLPATFFQVLDLIINLFDRVYQIEDADRGQAPNGVIAAAAIQALQERNQVLMQAKTSSIDSLVENRSRWAIGLWQNFGVVPEIVNVNGDPVPFIGVDYAGQEFTFTVESGSTMPRTSLQQQETALELFKMGAIDVRALLEVMNFPNWQEIVERTAEGQLEQALQLLIQAGLPEEQAQQLYQYLAQQQGGPGDVETRPKTSEGQTQQTRDRERENATV